MRENHVIGAAGFALPIRCSSWVRLRLPFESRDVDVGVRWDGGGDGLAAVVVVVVVRAVAFVRTLPAHARREPGRHQTALKVPSSLLFFFAISWRSQVGTYLACR